MKTLLLLARVRDEGHAWRIVLPLLRLARAVAVSVLALFLALFAAFVAVTSLPPATGGMGLAALVALGVALHLAWRRWETGLRAKAMPAGRDLALVATAPAGEPGPPSASGCHGLRSWKSWPRMPGPCACPAEARSGSRA